MKSQTLLSFEQAIVDAAMDLEAADKAKFWSVYEGYQKEMKGVWDGRLANIKKYAQNFEKMTDPVADELAARGHKGFELPIRLGFVRKAAFQPVAQAGQFHGMELQLL